MGGNSNSIMDEPIESVFVFQAGIGLSLNRNRWTILIILRAPEGQKQSAFVLHHILYAMYHDSANVHVNIRRQNAEACLQILTVPVPRMDTERPRPPDSVSLAAAHFNGLTFNLDAFALYDVRLADAGTDSLSDKRTPSALLETVLAPSGLTQVDSTARLRGEGDFEWCTATLDALESAGWIARGSTTDFVSYVEMKAQLQAEKQKQDPTLPTIRFPPGFDKSKLKNYTPRPSSVELSRRELRGDLQKK